MKTLFRNFKYIFRRFFAASILNLFGIALSFAAFVVIMTQVDYDYNYDKGIKDHNNIFLVETYDSIATDSYQWISRPLAEVISECAPQIEATAILFPEKVVQDVKVNENIFNVPFCYGFGDYMKVFQPKMICGSTDAIDREQPNRVLIPESMAQMIFGSVDVLDTVMHVYYAGNEDDVYIGGVYKDFPENATLKNVVYAACWPGTDQGAWQNNNYYVYVRLNSSDSKATVEEAGAKQIEAVDIERIKGIKINLTPLTDLHFKFGESSKFMVYLLICASFLLIVIAAVNYINFALAETPMRLRSINTQKVLGSTTARLRLILIGESVLVCMIAFIISVGILFLLPQLGIEELVSTNISPLYHPTITIGAFLLCIAIGIVAGIYPAWYATSFPPALVLKGSYGLSPQGKILRTTLICIQFTISFALIVCIGVMYMQSYFIQTADYGYDKEAIIIGNMTNETRQQKDAVRNELMKIQGIEGVSFSKDILSERDEYMGWGRSDEEHSMNFSCLPVDYNYLTVMGIKIIQGRNFKEHDGDVYIFNEAALRQYPWLELDKKILSNDFPVVGFCENVKFNSFRIDNDNVPMAFMVFGEAHKYWQKDCYFNVRIMKNIDKIKVTEQMQSILEQFTPHHDFDIRFIDQILNQTYQSEMRFQKQITLFSILAIIISLIGVFGLTMFENEYRRKEIGLRKIMGSSTTSVLWIFNSRYAKILAGCFIIGAPLGWKFSSEWLKNFAERTPIYWWIFPAAFAIVVIFTLFIVTYQTWKNACRNPIESIRTE